MKDPFPLEPIPWLVEATRPIAKVLAMPSLPYHIHEVFASALLYTVIYWPISPLLSKLVVGNRYNALPRRRRVNWDAHVVSMFQSLLINALALWVIYADEERSVMTPQERVWGYTGASGMIQALAAGYFLWDLVVTSFNMDVFGPGTLAHAISALAVYSFGFRPFVNYYAPIFILWELSTPFLNVHWFFDKLGMTGTRAQLYNGLMLLFTFFSARLVYGTYQSYAAFKDIWALLGTNPVLPKAADGTELPASDVLLFATSATAIPLWLGVIYLISNCVLNFLNFYWFVMMIRAVRKRFVPTTEKKPLPVAAQAVSTAHISAESPVSASKPRRRKA